MLQNYAIAVILSLCEESSLNGYKANSLSRLFKLDSSQMFGMTAIVSFKLFTIYGSIFLSLRAMELPFTTIKLRNL